MKRMGKIFACALVGAMLIPGLSITMRTTSLEVSAKYNNEMGDLFDSDEVRASTERKEVLDESDIIYMILTDRFYDADPSNNGTLGKEYRPGKLKYTQGGDWKGIQKKLDYIKDLGVTAIWISPPSKNELLSRDGQESGYHGYFTHDYNEADPHYGTKQELIDLVSAAHKKGLKVILDVVPNHTADYFDGAKQNYSSESNQPAAPFNNPEWYHHYGDITDWNDEYQVQNYDLGGLDDIDQSNPEARKAIEEAYFHWVNDTGADGVRVDAARSLPKDFIKEFEDKLGVPSFGEVFVGDVDYVSSFSNSEWGVLDFPLFFQAREAFAHDASFKNVKKILDQDFKYRNVNHLVNFMDNHDRDRFLCLAGDNYQKLRLAMTFMFTVRGIPDVYYGTEQNCYGGGKPTEWAGIANKENREMMPGFDQQGNMYQTIQRLCELRKSYRCLQTGTQREMWCEDKIYAFSRRDDKSGQEVITVINNATTDETRAIPIRSESSLRTGDQLVNFLNTNDQTTVKAGGITGRQLSLEIPAKTAFVFVGGDIPVYKSPERTVTTIRVHYDTGYGNKMYLRGDSYPLTWGEGREMLNASSDVWTYETERIPENCEFEFKAMFNDQKWSTGMNYKGYGGKTVDIYPSF